MHTPTRCAPGRPISPPYLPHISPDAQLAAAQSADIFDADAADAAESAAAPGSSEIGRHRRAVEEAAAKAAALVEAAYVAEP